MYDFLNDVSGFVPIAAFGAGPKPGGSGKNKIPGKTTKSW